MVDETKFFISGEQSAMVPVAIAQAALAGVGQLARELETTIGAEAAQRVRDEATKAFKAAGLPTELEQRLLRHLRS